MFMWAPHDIGLAGSSKAISAAQSTRLPRTLISTCIYTLLLFVSLPAESKTLLEPVIFETNETPISKNFVYLEDPAGALTYDQALQKLDEGAFSKLPQNNPALGLSDSVYWLAAQVQPRRKKESPYFLEIAFPQLDDLRLVTRYQNRTTTHPQLGDKLPFSERPIPHRHFLFPLMLTGESPTDLLLRIESTSPIKAPVSIWNRRTFWESDQYSLMGHAGYLGIIIVMSLYSLLIFMSATSRVYLFFIGSVSMLGIVHACLSGIAYQFIWSDSPRWNQLAAPVAACLSTFFFSLFADSCLELKRHHLKLSKSHKILAALALSLTLVGPACSVRVFSDSVVLLTVALALTSITSGVLCSLRGDPAARYHLAGWAALLIGATHTTLSQRGYDIPRASVEHGLPLGSGIAAILLSFALGHRINSLEAERQSATQVRTKLHTQMTTRLTARVHIFSRIAGDLNSAITKMSQKLKILEDNLVGAGSTIDYLFVGSELNKEAREAKDKLENAVQNRNSTLGDIREDFNRVQEIVENMRGLGTIGGTVTEQTELAFLINRAISRLRANDSNFTLEDFVLEYQAPAPGLYAPVRGNSYLIVHALEAVFLKAYRSAINQTTPHVLLDHTRDGEQICLTLKYNGAPLPAEEVEQLFLHTKNPGARTLGVVRTLLQQQSGDIRLLDAGNQSGWIQFEITLATTVTEAPPPEEEVTAHA